MSLFRTWGGVTVVKPVQNVVGGGNSGEACSERGGGGNSGSLFKTWGGGVTAVKLVQNVGGNSCEAY